MYTEEKNARRKEGGRNRNVEEDGEENREGTRARRRVVGRGREGRREGGS